MIKNQHPMHPHMQLYKDMLAAHQQRIKDMHATHSKMMESYHNAVSDHLDRSITRMESMLQHMQDNKSSQLSCSMLQSTIDGTNHLKRGMAHYKDGSATFRKHAQRLAMGVFGIMGLSGAVNASDLLSGAAGAATGGAGTVPTATVTTVHRESPAAPTLFTSNIDDILNLLRDEAKAAKDEEEAAEEEVKAAVEKKSKATEAREKRYTRLKATANYPHSMSPAKINDLLETPGISSLLASTNLDGSPRQRAANYLARLLTVPKDGDRFDNVLTLIRSALTELVNNTSPLPDETDALHQLILFRDNLQKAEALMKEVAPDLLPARNPARGGAGAASSSPTARPVLSDVATPVSVSPRTVRTSPTAVGGAGDLSPLAPQSEDSPRGFLSGIWGSASSLLGRFGWGSSDDSPTPPQSSPKSDGDTPRGGSS